MNTEATSNSHGYQSTPKGRTTAQKHGFQGVGFQACSTPAGFPSRHASHTFFSTYPYVAAFIPNNRLHCYATDATAGSRSPWGHVFRFPPSFLGRNALQADINTPNRLLEHPVLKLPVEWFVQALLE